MKKFLYDDTESYDFIHPTLSGADFRFYLELANEYGNPVLEIACGTGRLTIPLAKAALEMTGLDISQAMIDKAKVNAKDQGVKINWLQGDCRRFSLGKQIFICKKI